MASNAPSPMMVTTSGGIGYVVLPPADMKMMQGYGLIATMTPGLNPRRPDEPTALYPISLDEKDISPRVNGHWSPKILAQGIGVGSQVMPLTPTEDGRLPQSPLIQTPDQILYENNTVTGIRNIGESELERLL